MYSGLLGYDTLCSRGMYFTILEVLPSTLKMKPVCPSKNLVSVCKTTRCHNPKDHNVNLYSRESLTSYQYCILN
jgi:hypothetical protein